MTDYSPYENMITTINVAKDEDNKFKMSIDGFAQDQTNLTIRTFFTRSAILKINRPKRWYGFENCTIFTVTHDE